MGLQLAGRDIEQAAAAGQWPVSGSREDSAAAQSPLDHRDGASRGPCAGLQFADCYAREMPALVWFVMSLGASREAAADAAQSAFTDAYPVWPTIVSPNAWLRRVAQRAYYRRVPRETLVESVPERPGPASTVTVVESHAEAQVVLAALAGLPPKQRQVMAWYIDGYSPAEIATQLNADPAAVRQNLAKARRNLKSSLRISGARDERA